ncbi:MAG: site-specific DNA-methyltransferase [Microcoleus sp. PH2017_15_JOR_U_A]|uniref:site-specific DNA-methyltransferase n=1 Tax=unclassified Microcoleus TaxID=2642155 RepID=UPI001D6801E5|nr:MULTISPECIES: site-specific DNA-methyltransferase [unclassified Microcoleus]MCC3476081.1 site-specific DNA-methyltransferase [Microcoleus sp. PH2017_13_LAR_U_A]MCC3488555.1 site-specific DNA-methyltransferase [Microcoleus sp. PH2017_14_LAR_D_A]MCC3498386.1 site-specific DNA-methyltransferase [Microcoleus sp. PH2017_15_JOR_U_A]MCC3601147.1 site-specific DNA-methyltransferase [Microcoleus sp. PH2017_26_ELK_O_A]MCC3626338.1 site-specific DNA-methyltransferase [Microcoleus sp. PH2017_36_ELK_O_B
MPRKKNDKSTPIDSVKHQDKRANIPTEELRDFMADDEKKPQKVLYPRDPSLDPQLVWQGKDEQDSQDLEVPAVPIYIQEKIHPHAIIEDFKKQVKKEQPAEQLSLFSDFNGLEFDQLIDFYQHKDGVKWANRMILGDSLLVMNSLAEKEGLKGKVQMIYLDPPYGIKFGSNWQVSTRKRDVKDGKAEEVTRQPEQVKAFRDTWELGIHSYLSYLRDRLVVARELLTETGSIFVQIGDDNVHLVRCLMDEVFGSENFISQISATTKVSLGSKYIAGVQDYIIWYSKNKESVKYRQLYEEKNLVSNSEFTLAQDIDGNHQRLTTEDKQEKSHISDNLKIFQRIDLLATGWGASTNFPIDYQGEKFYPLRGKSWKTHLPGIQRLKLANRIIKLGGYLRYKSFFDDYPVSQITNVWAKTAGGFSESKVYVVQTNPKIIENCLLMTTDPGDLVLDPTCGSGTTAYVAEQWGRRWITIDTSRVALALARTRLMSAKYPYYLLTDSPEGIQKEAEITKQLPSTQPKTDNAIKKGFVYKRVPHVTLGSIANNPEIDTIHAKWHLQLEPVRTQLNQLLKKSWEEWEIPRESDAKWSDEAKELIAKWWQLRQQRQKEIDESIARNADTELLYDQPYENNKRIRITGPFTVESLSPHRILSTDEAYPASEQEGVTQASDQFEVRIIDNLKRAGIQNTLKNQRLKFENLEYLESHAGTYIHAVGEYAESDETIKRVAVHIGPEYGTVSVDDIKEAAKEAVKGLGNDVLIVCGFAFEPNVNEEAKRYGKLQVLIARMNPDLLLGDELLKKTGAGNLFMVFGEPDIELKRQNGQLVVTLKGLDIYDPTTGEIRSSSPDDIACWFIDTDYNEESFFVRHAYFTGANQPYEKLKRALKAEIDEDAWSQMYSTTSRPFDSPKGKNGKSGKIAVKVINHYGDEVLKVYESL